MATTGNVPVESAAKENNENAESPIKKRLRSRKEAARMVNLEAVPFAKDKCGSTKPPAEIKEKHLEVLKANVSGLNRTDKYYSDSQKKIEVFMGESENCAAPPIKATQNPKPSAAEKTRPKSSLRSPRALPPASVLDLMKPDPQLMTKLLNEEKDERYHYLARNGTVTFVEPVTHTIFVELPQIPNVTIAYRRPAERLRAKKAFVLSSKQLNAVPLFEGEESLEELELSKNMITKMENLVSLPKLQVLDLSFNKISQMTNMNTLQGLRTLNLSHNCIMQVDGMNYLKALEVLNLQSNLIGKIAGLAHLTKLRVLNMSENMVESLDGAEVVVSLKELYISKNNVNDMGRIQTLPRLEILDVSHNCIKMVSKECAGKLQQSLKELRIDHNPCESEPMIEEIMQRIRQAPSVLPLEADRKPEESSANNRPVASPFKNLAEALNYAKAVEKGATIPQHEQQQYSAEQNDTLEKIRSEWKHEEERLLLHAGPVKPSVQKTFLVTSDKSGTVLHLCGAGALDSLTAPEYENSVVEITFEFVKFEHIVYPPVLQQLKKYKNLNSVTLASNCLSSFVLLSKLEVLDKIRKLWIRHNPVCRLATLEAFVTYRFQHVAEINGKPIGPEAKRVAKQEFERFDRSLAAATLANKKHVSYKKLGCSKAAIKNIAKENELAAANRSQKVLAESEAIGKQRKATISEAEEFVTSFVYSYVAKLEDGSYADELQ